MVSEIFEADRWQPVTGFDLRDITYHQSLDGRTVRIAFNRPECRNAFRPQTVDELYRTLEHARTNSQRRAAPQNPLPEGGRRSVVIKRLHFR